MIHRHVVLSPLVVLSIAALLAVPALAQHMGHGAQGGMQGTQAGQHGQMMAADQMMRNIESMMTNIQASMRDLAAMPMSGGHHDGMLAGMNGMLEQMRAVHGDLATMMKDPQLMHQDDAMKAFNEACRDLERMASAFQSMTKHMNQAMKGLHNERK